MKLENLLLKRKRLGNLRMHTVTQNLIDFASNDYLGLAKSPALIDSVAGLGSTGSRLLTGNSIYAQDLEKRIASFHEVEAGLLFNCGYMANVGLISTIAGSCDTIFFDSKVHASTHDGIRLSKAAAFPFRHNDLGHLESRLNKCTKGDRYICVESIYSTDGSQSPLVEICRLGERFEANVIVDEAHAVGAYGPKGRGLVAEHGLKVFAQIVTFGKALGTFGAIVLGSSLLKETLINFASPHIYTTALPFYALAAIRCSYDLFPTLDSERLHLQKLIRLFSSSSTAIQPVLIPGNEEVRERAKKLAQQGFDVRALTSPTVQRGQEALRICLHAFNTEDEVKSLLRCIHA